ncbi:MAG: hypothetical protein M3Y37_08860, partial [Chloroflexota bacterium]|nr:hypothetical protein [Chloroflexota bacterium]
MIRRPFRRAWRAYLRDLIARARPPASGRAAVERPVRLLPERVRVWEEYRYSFTAGPSPVYRQSPDRVSGDIQIDLPFDRLSPAARADAAAVLGIEPGAVIARYGALGFSRLERTDIPARFFNGSSFSHYALPLTAPLVREGDPALIIRAERGDHERQHLYYTPADPVPFPFTLDISISEDAATFRRDARPTPISGQQRVMHVGLEVSMLRPPRVREEDVRLSLDVFMLFWCAPVAPYHFVLDGPPDATLNVDARMNAVAVSGATIPFTSDGRGLLRGAIEFRILIKEPVDFLQASEVKGLFKVTGHGIT